MVDDKRVADRQSNDDGDQKWQGHGRYLVDCEEGACERRCMVRGE